MKFKVITAASAVAVSALLLTGCFAGAETEAKSANANSTNAIWPTGPDIGGGVSYPMIGDKTGPYYVNDNAHKMTLNHGRVPLDVEVKAWDIEIMAGYVYAANPDAPGLPEGSGSVEEGEELYEAQCVMCHGDFGSGAGGNAGNYPALSGGNAYEGQKTLTNNRYRDEEADGPTRNFGSFWPQASTMWWYIRDAMPHPYAKSLSDDEVYALTAYMLYINEIIVDGELVEEEYVLDREKFIKIKMPNEDGFEPNIKGPGALQRVRDYYADASNYGSERVNPSERCMKDCQDPKAIVVGIPEGGGIDTFTPPMSAVRDLPAVKEEKINVEEAYAASCAMCHDGFLSVGDSMWEGYTAKGMDKVYENGIKGTSTGMPAKGGTSMSDDNFKLLVDYLINGK